MRPDYPWLTNDANDILACYLKQTDVGLEFGSGRSTLWFAKHTHYITSVEHDRGWYERVAFQVAGCGVRNLDYRFVPCDPADVDGCDAASQNFS